MIGAILMVLAAVQSLGYRVPLPGRVVPAVIAALGALALLATMAVLRAAVPNRRWSLVLVVSCVVLALASTAWVAVSWLRPGASLLSTVLWSLIPAVAGVAVVAAYRWTRSRQIHVPDFCQVGLSLRFVAWTRKGSMSPRVSEGWACLG